MNMAPSSFLLIAALPVHAYPTYEIVIYYTILHVQIPSSLILNFLGFWSTECVSVSSPHVLPENAH